MVGSPRPTIVDLQDPLVVLALVGERPHGMAQVGLPLVRNIENLSLRRSPKQEQRGGERERDRPWEDSRAPRVCNCRA
jgi:hypothetical protein